MARKKVVVSDVVKEIQNLLKENKLIIGKDRTLKDLKRGKIKKIFLANNYPEDLINDIKYYTNLAKVEVIVTEKNNEELGLLCKKPFFISVLGVKK